MSISTTPVPFCDDRLSITVDECSAKYLEYMRRKVPLSVREFSGGRRMRIEKVDGADEFIFESPDGLEFAKGLVVK